MEFKVLIFNIFFVSLCCYRIIVIRLYNPLRGLQP